MDLSEDKELRADDERKLQLRCKMEQRDSFQDGWDK